MLVGPRRALFGALLVVGCWSAAASAQPASAIDINTADSAALTALPGVGKAIAERIVASRSAEGPFRSADDLRRVKGIGAKTLERLRPHVTVEGAPTRAVDTPRDAQGEPPSASTKDRKPVATAGVAVRGSININIASVDELRALPGIGPKTAEAIVAERAENGPFSSIENLTRVKGIGQGKLARLKAFITTGP